VGKLARWTEILKIGMSCSYVWCSVHYGAVSIENIKVCYQWIVLVYLFSFLPTSLTSHTCTPFHRAISEAMRIVTDPADFLATPYRFLFNSTLVTDTLNYLTPDNSVVFIGTQKLNFNGSSHPTVTQDSPENVPWPVLTEVCCYYVWRYTT